MINKWHPTQAIGPDGQRTDIKDVANGLKCRCVCFECEQPVIAKQGPKLRWHFAHHAPTNCRPSPESELHFFAKFLLADRLWLWIPAVHANAAEWTKCISERRKYGFVEVRVEKADGNVRPDLLLIAGRRKILHVEIYVRHKVDPAKLEKLKTRGISSIEIDLSHLDWDDRTKWEASILETAPREWLHNAKAAGVEREMIESAAREAEKIAAAHDAEYSSLSSIWKAADASYHSPSEQLLAERALAIKRGFYSMTAHPSKGADCFLVPAEFWQSLLVNRFLWNELAGSPRKFETKHALAHVQDLVRPGLNRISTAVAARMEKEFPEFQTPWFTVHNYLKWLKTDHWMFDKRVHGKQWLASGSAIHRRNEQEAEWQHTFERKADLAEWVDYILSNIPKREHRDFDRTRWIDWFVATYEEGEARKLHEAIHEMVVGGRGLAEDLAGLPLMAEYQRQKQSQAKRHAEEQRKRRVQLEQLERESRIASMSRQAEQTLEGEAQAWLETVNEHLSGISPIAAAEASDDGRAHAVAELQRHQQERQQEINRKAAEIQRVAALEQQTAALEKNRVELVEFANKHTRDPVRASLWCKSPNPKLGGQRPFDYCTDDRALQICKQIMPSKL